MAVDRRTCADPDSCHGRRYHEAAVVTTLDVSDRRDLHNSSVSFAAAVAGRCGFTHLASGRVCLLRHRHPGPCYLAIAADDESSMTDAAGLDKAQRFSSPICPTVARSRERCKRTRQRSFGRTE